MNSTNQGAIIGCFLKLKWENLYFLDNVIAFERYCLNLNNAKKNSTYVSIPQGEIFSS